MCWMRGHGLSVRLRQCRRLWRSKVQKVNDASAWVRAGLPHARRTCPASHPIPRSRSRSSRPRWASWRSCRAAAARSTATRGCGRPTDWPAPSCRGTVSESDSRGEEEPDGEDVRAERRDDVVGLEFRQVVPRAARPPLVPSMNWVKNVTLKPMNTSRHAMRPRFSLYILPVIFGHQWCSRRSSRSGPIPSSRSGSARRRSTCRAGECRPRACPDAGRSGRRSRR